MILAQKIVRPITGLLFRHRIAAALVAIPCFGVVAAFGIAPDTMVEPVATSYIVESLELPKLTPAAEDNSSFVREERIQRGETLASLLARLEVTDPEVLELLRSNKQFRPLHQLIPGRTVQATSGPDGTLQTLRYLNGENLLTVARTASGYEFKQEQANLERRLIMKSAIIRHSLFGASDAIGMSDAVASQIANIFSTDIDFHRDLRKGDRFSAVYEAFYHHGEPVRTGRVLAAEFINQGKTYQAIYFDQGGNQGGYYTPDGKNLRKQFLRSPLEFSRITSGFSPARFHPVLQTWRAHKGIDYAAPTGTKVKATGDAIVDFVGRQGGYGNVVVLRHQKKYTTWYGHLSGFASGIQKGKRVAQGDVIGYVGSTGLATGPHLHYEFRVDDVHQNPLLAALPDAPPITPDLKRAFDLSAQPLARNLDLVRTMVYARLD